MIEMTRGILILAVSVVGILASVTGLVITGPMFWKQRKKLLDEMKMGEKTFQ